MRAYLRYFTSVIQVMLQYRASAFAGLVTQFFWGIMYALIYTAFYSFTNIDNISISELMCYVWLNQAFLMLIYYGGVDKNIVKDIQDGTVSYELCRPYDLYFWWFLKVYAKKIACTALRFGPVLLVALFLPQPYNLSLPISFPAFGLFVLTLLLGGVLMSTVELLVLTITFFLYAAKGISSVTKAIFSLFSGYTIPLPLMPAFILAAIEFLPFRFIGDLPFRLYSGNINISYGLFSLLMQIAWILVFVIIGKIILHIALKRATVQGG